MSIADLAFSNASNPYYSESWGKCLVEPLDPDVEALLSPLAQNAETPDEDDDDRLQLAMSPRDFEPFTRIDTRVRRHSIRALLRQDAISDHVLHQEPLLKLKPAPKTTQRNTPLGGTWEVAKPPTRYSPEVEDEVLAAQQRDREQFQKQREAEAKSDLPEAERIAKARDDDSISLWDKIFGTEGAAVQDDADADPSPDTYHRSLIADFSPPPLALPLTLLALLGIAAAAGAVALPTLAAGAAGALVVNAMSGDEPQGPHA